MWGSRGVRRRPPWAFQPDREGVLTVSNGTAIEPFEFNGNPVRVVMINEEPWFVASDITTALGFTRARDAVRMVDNEDKGAHQMRTPGGMQEVIILSESGMYTLVLRSDRPDAKAFKRWVTHEVLPAIRKTGAYVTPVAAARNADLDALRTMIDAIEQTRAEQERQAAAIESVTQRTEETEARVAAIEGRHDWFSALGYARLHDLPTSHVWLNRLGRTAGQIGRRQGLEAHKTQHSLFGEVNMWPEWVWTAAVVARRTAGDPEAQ